MESDSNVKVGCDAWRGRLLHTQATDCGELKTNKVMWTWDEKCPSKNTIFSPCVMEMLITSVCQVSEEKKKNTG